MKKLSLIFTVIALAGVTLSSCKKAQEVVPNTSNELADIYATLDGLGTKRVAEPRFSASNDTIYFDLPYFYPVDSDNEVDLSQVILRSTVPSDAIVTPGLGVLQDVSKPFNLNITSGSGETRSFVVVSRKVGDLSVADAKITYQAGGSTQEITAVIKDSDVFFYILPGTDISNVRLDLEINKHSSSSIPSGTAMDLSKDVPLTITGVDGSKKVYTLKATEPVKLDYGVGINRRMFVKTAAELGFTTNMETSLAVTGDYLVTSVRTNPSVYKVYNRYTGAYIKDLPLPFSALSFQVAHDAGGNLLGATYAAKNGKMIMYKWSSIDAVPEKLIEWTNNNPTGITGDGGAGRRINVYGNVNTNAVIMSPAGQSSIIYKWRIANGVLVSNTPEVIRYKSVTGGAASFMGYNADAQPTSADANADYFVNYQFEIGLVNGTTHERTVGFANETAVFGIFHFATDYIEFNNAKYLAVQKLVNTYSYNNAIMGIFDVTETSKIGLSAADPRYRTFNIYNSEIFVGANPNANGTGDICIALSPDKERMQVYMLLTNGGIMAHEFTKYTP
ncbi:uncharacterized protein DUF5018 [Arcticibacter pallidicorallinus]|uniref:Uncharacterized protein DUF5018 n=1 Tax=Arcticibacter pallidicorallinus TaxID=1259464 RepID=A0A2T0U0N8_9SPHI|nr:DUF5018 domain-containing protein [Arcticibacter pallidicorallinus]PRY51472.1 uncharacterized protein DUF5018 [Arcticibacter pallidicorallinus]